MIEPKKYLSLLSEVMKNTNDQKKENNKNFEELYSLVHLTLDKQLRNSMYPDVPNITKEMNRFVESIEPLYLVSEVVGKKCVLISNYCTSDIFKTSSLFLEEDFIRPLNRVFTQIPFIIVDSEDCSIEVMNNSDIRIKLTVSDFKSLLIGSSQYKIAINKIIQFIIIRTKLSNDNLCIISDNIYGDGRKLFNNIIDKKIIHLDLDGFCKIDEKVFDKYDAILASKEVASKLEYHQKEKLTIFPYSYLHDYLSNNTNVILYGFIDKFRAIAANIFKYYDKQILRSEKILHDIIGDLVLLNNRDEDILHHLRQEEKNKEEILKLERTNIKNILEEIESVVSKIEQDFNDVSISDKTIPKHVFDNIFELIFTTGQNEVDLTSNFEKLEVLRKATERLDFLGYDDFDLVSKYINHLIGRKVSCIQLSLGSDEWEKAKMIIEVSELTKIPLDTLKKCVDVLGRHCETGKEYYAKSLVVNEDYKCRFLKKSFDEGYLPAADALINRYKNNDRSVNLFTLANALVPEACMLIVMQKEENAKKTHRFVQLSDDVFTYYKIAASRQYLPAIGKIVDIIYESRFSSAYYIDSNKFNDPRNSDTINYGNTICELCNFLIRKEYKIPHYKEILGVVLFCLNDNRTESMYQLKDIDSAISNYCKGSMYESGRGAIQDYDKAIEYYEKSLQQGFSPWKINERIDICNQKKKNMTERNGNYYYQSDQDYSSKREYIDSSIESGCFVPESKIFLKNGKFKKVEDLVRGDEVVVYDHYNGCLDIEIIVANVHEIVEEKLCKIIKLDFENGVNIEIVQSHAFFDMMENTYILLDDENVEKFIGHEFAFLEEKEIKPTKLIDYSIEYKLSKYYAPISKKHLNVFVEGFLTMPPTKLTINLFRIKDNMQYDLTILDETGETEYSKLKKLISKEEYEDLPCCYFEAIMSYNKCSIEEFCEILELYREQYKRINL